MRFGTRAGAWLVVFLARPILRGVHWWLAPTLMTIALGFVLDLSSWKSGVGLLVGSLVVWVALVSMASNRVKHVVTDYAAAFARGDADAMERFASIIPRLEYPLDARLAEVSARARRAERLVVREQWEEARALLAEIVDVPNVHVQQRAGLLNNLAYAIARTTGTGGVEIAERALAAAKEARMDDTAIRATLGAALARVGRCDEALPLLEATTPASENDRVKNDRLYWLGYAYRALGRKDDAREAFSAAAQLDGPCREEARAALADETPFRT